MAWPAMPHHAAGSAAPCNCHALLALTRSVGEATEMPMAPVVRPAIILMPRPGSPSWPLGTCKGAGHKSKGDDSYF